MFKMLARRWPLPAAVALIAIGGLWWATSDRDVADPSAAAAEVTPEPIVLHVEIASTVRNVVHTTKVGDSRPACVYYELRWVVRDEAGRVMTTGERSLGDDTRSGLAGDLRWIPFRCTVELPMETLPADAYQVEVTATGLLGQTATGAGVATDAEARDRMRYGKPAVEVMLE